MSNTNTGGPAFPIDRQTAHGIAIKEVGAGDEAAYIEAVAKLSQGMTLRDYFAAKALQGMLAENGGGAMSNVKLAEWAYDIADSMLKAREQ